MSAHYHQLAFFQETTQGTGPANAAAWLAAVAAPPSGFRVAPLKGTIDTSGIGPSVLDDETVQDMIFDDRGDLIGIDNPEFPFETYAETAGAATATAAQIALTAQMWMAQHALGGLDRNETSTADTAAATLHSTTAVEVDDASSYTVGGHIAVQLQNYTGVGGASACHVREIIDITGNVLTVDEPFPVAPVDGDVVNACATGYILESRLQDSDGAGGPWTFSAHVGRGPTGSGPSWEVNGGKLELGAMNFERDNFGKIAWKMFGGSSRLPHEAVSPSWVSPPANEPPLQVGVNTALWFADHGAAGAKVSTNAFVVDDPGVPVVPIPAITTDAVGMEGRCGYTTTRKDTMVSVTFCHHDSDVWSDFISRGYKSLRWSALCAPGSGFAVSFPRCQISNLPDFVDVNDAAMNAVKFKAFRNTDDNGDTELIRSKIKLVWY